MEALSSCATPDAARGRSWVTTRWRSRSRARQHGACVMALRDSHHLGRIGHLAEQCAAAGLVSVHFVNVPNGAVVAPFGGLEARLGTILDGAGRATTDAAALFGTPPGVLLPFGEHKGFGLALACELLAGALTGGRTQDGTSDGVILNAMLSVVISPEVLGTAAAFAAKLESLAAWVRSGASDGEVRLPGEPESERKARRLREGIPVDPVTWAEVKAAAASLGLGEGQFDAALVGPAGPG